MQGTKKHQADAVKKASAKHPIKDFFSVLVSADDQTVYRVRGGIDKPFFILVMILICLGSIAVATSGYVYAKESGKFGHDSFYFIKKQVVWTLLGIAVMLFMSFVDYGFIKRMGIPIFIISIFLLLLVFVPGIGVSSHGARRWINLGVQFQPSEVMKFGLVVILSLYISKAENKIENARYGILYPACIVLFVCGLVVLEKHMSATIILFLIGASMIFISGASKKWIMGIGGTFTALAASLILFTDYTKARVDAWLHPENHLLEGGYQPYESLLAIGSGGFFGTGLTGSYQKHLWLPEPYNDFIFAIWSEEFGFIGSVALVAVFVLFTWRGFTIAKKAPDTFSSLLVIGLTLKVSLQALLNIAVVTCTIPTTGIALPFFSYGGTALVMQLAEMGIILSISRFQSGERADIDTPSERRLRTK